MRSWGLSDIPDLSGKLAMVTGGNIGLGYRSALELARSGAGVTIGCRRPEEGEKAIAKIKREVPNARLTCFSLDLTDFASIKMFANAFTSEHDHLDILMNNAGVVNLETLARTKEGHEMHMATNHYGHYALTSHLFATLCGTPGARVVTMTSVAYKSGKIQFDDMDWQKRPYSRLKAYGDSKLANLLFTHELQKRFDEVGATAVAVAAHPGLTGTERQQRIGIGGHLTKWVASPVSEGVAPQLRAATDPAVLGGELYGPRFKIRGRPIVEKIGQIASDAALANRLWSFTGNVTGCAFIPPNNASKRDAVTGAPS